MTLHARAVFTPPTATTTPRHRHRHRRHRTPSVKASSTTTTTAVYNAESPDEGALVDAARSLGFVFATRNFEAVTVEVPAVACPAADRARKSSTNSTNTSSTSSTKSGSSRSSSADAKTTGDNNEDGDEDVVVDPLATKTATFKVGGWVGSAVFERRGPRATRGAGLSGGWGCVRE